MPPSWWTSTCTYMAAVTPVTNDWSFTAETDRWWAFQKQNTAFPSTLLIYKKNKRAATQSVSKCIATRKKYAVHLHENSLSTVAAFFTIIRSFTPISVLAHIYWAQSLPTLSSVVSLSLFIGKKVTKTLDQFSLCLPLTHHKISSLLLGRNGFRNKVKLLIIKRLIELIFLWEITQNKIHY